MPPNQSSGGDHPQGSQEMELAMASYSVNIKSEGPCSSDSSTFSRMSTPTPPVTNHFSSGSPAQVSTTSSSARAGSMISQVPDPIGSSVEWGSSASDAASASVPQHHPAQVAAQIASKGGIRHNIMGLTNAPNVSSSTATSVSSDATTAGPIPMNVMSQGTPTPLEPRAMNSGGSGGAGSHRAPVNMPSTIMSAASPIPVPMQTQSSSPTGASSKFSLQLYEATANYQNLTFDSGSANHPEGGTATERKQKRLQRNRESARLSRKRRKQYLEVLESRVNYLCEEMDRGRREHVLGALGQIVQMRNNSLHDLEQKAVLINNRMPDENEIHQKVMMLGREGLLSRTSPELMMAITFGREYLKSLVIPPSKKYIMWLTLQNDIFYRGGRAASERLSAARIGEKLRSCGHTHVIPSNGMWPLFCNEVALSYDQEERIRSLQKDILSKQESWLHRHTGASSEHILQSSHNAITNVSEATVRREMSLMDVLTPLQKAKFLVWVAHKRKNNAQKMATLITSRFIHNESSGDTQPTAQRHEAANLYIINHKLSTVASNFPSPNRPILPASALAKFARRPAFESLATVDDIKGVGPKKGRKMSKDLSSGNLKRCSSEISCDNLDGVDERGFMKKSASGTSLCGTSSLTPEAAQSACSTFVVQALGEITNLIPRHRLTNQDATQGRRIQPAPVVNHTPQVKIESARPQSPTLASMNLEDYSNEIGFYNSNPQSIVPTPVQSTPMQTVPTTVGVSDNQHQQYISVPIPEPVPIAPLSSTTTNLGNYYSAASPPNPTLTATSSEPVLSKFRKVPTPLSCISRETKEELSSEYIDALMPMDDVGFWNVSNQMADNSLFDLKEEDWAIGEGAFLD